MASLTLPNQTSGARKWSVLINTGTLSSQVWTAVDGIVDCNPNLFAANIESAGIYNDNGRASSTKTGFDAWKCELKLVRRYVAATGAYDVGQEKLRTHAYAVGPSGVAVVQIVDRDGGDEAYQGYCEVSWGPDGGKSTDLEGVKVTLYGQGDPELIVNPLAGS